MNEIAVIILNYNKYELTINAALNLINNGYQSKVIIVDNKSTNDSYNIMKEFFNKIDSIDIIATEKNGGYSYGNNFGIHYVEKKYLDVKYIVVMNPDVEVYDISIINKMKTILEKNPQFGTVSPLQILNSTYGGPNCGYWKIPNGIQSIFDLTYFGRLLKRDLSNKVIKTSDEFLIETEATVGSFFMVKIETLQLINYLDDAVFLYYEENILGSKLMQNQLKEVVMLNSFFSHNHTHNDAYSMSLSQLINNLKLTHASKRYFLKNYLKTNWVLLIIESIIWNINLVFMMIVWLLKRKLRGYAR